MCLLWNGRYYDRVLLCCHKLRGREGDLDELVPDVLAHDVDDPPAVGGEELVRPLVEGDHLGGGERD